MELSIKTIKEVLRFSSYGEVASTRKLAVKQLCDILDTYCDLDITLKQAEQLEGLTARQITWLRQIFNLKLV
jgi:tRNA A37 N6-isopentenylltransferase MiaA